jgi:hypothetical protein
MSGWLKDSVWEQGASHQNRPAEECQCRRINEWKDNAPSIKSPKANSVVIWAVFFIPPR